MSTLLGFNPMSVVSLDGHAIDPEVGSKVLVEGNYFNSVRSYLRSQTGQ